MKKRFLGLLLSVMLISVCVGCGAESTTTEPTETVTVTTTEESATKQTEEATATPEETAEPTPEATEEPSEETTTEPETEPTEIAEPEPTEEPTPEPQAIYTYTDMSATMYAQQTVNVRDLPDTSGNKLGSLSTNDEIKISGKCNETGWYMFEYNDSVAFVSNKYIGENKVEIKQAPADNDSSGQESATTECPYPMYQVIDDGGDSVYYYCTENDINWAIYDQCAEIIANRHGHSLYQNGGDCGKGGGLAPVKTNYTYNGQTVYRQRPCAFISPPGAGPAGATEIFQCP